MRAAKDNLDEFLGNLLRGVNKIVGCNSTNLVVINEKTREMAVRVATVPESHQILERLEDAMGETFRGLAVPFEAATDSLITRVWREGEIQETSSLVDMIGSAIPADIVAQFEVMAGERRYLLIPTFGNHRRFGVLLFEKPGLQPFSRQQREVLLRYARRIGEIIENDLLGHKAERPEVDTDGQDLLVFDARGELAGVGQDTERPTDDQIESLGELARISLEESGSQPEESKFEGRRLRIQQLRLMDQNLALCSLSRRLVSDGSSLETQLLHLTLGLPAPAVFVDPDLRITSANQAFEELSACPADELIGRSIDDLFKNPAEIAGLLARLTMLSDGSSSSTRAVLRNQDGSISEAQVEALPLADDKDRAIGFLLLIRPRDAGGERLSTKRLIQQERLATMGEMAAQLAHDIRNPLVAIGATLESLSRGQGDERQKRMLQSASREIARMDMILRKYLSARVDMVFTDVTLHDLIQDVRRLLEGTRRRDGKRVSVQVEPQLLVRVDYDSMKHLLFNLLLNALEASPPGGEVICRVEAGAQDISIFVEDRGTGLSAPAAECLQPFFTTKSSGTGLGLTVCQKIAKAHGGLLQLDQRQDGGCQAAVILPVRSNTGANDS